MSRPADIYSLALKKMSYPLFSRLADIFSLPVVV